MFQLEKATRQKRKLRIVVDGPSGSGKSYTLLRLAHLLIREGLAKAIAVIDTENNSASLYAGEAPDGEKWEFVTGNLTNYSPTDYVSAIKFVESNGIDCCVVDSLSHAWAGAGGALEMADKIGEKKGNKFTAWGSVTPEHQKLIDAIVGSQCHMLCTMRTKTEWELEKNEHGKNVPVRVGTKAVQRDGFEYEFDIYCRISADGLIRVEKTRCSAMRDASAFRAGYDFWMPLIAWLKQGTEGAPELVAVDNSQSLYRNFMDKIAASNSESELKELAEALKNSGLSGNLLVSLRKAYTERQNALKKGGA